MKHSEIVDEYSQRLLEAKEQIETLEGEVKDLKAQNEDWERNGGSVAIRIHDDGATLHPIKNSHSGMFGVRASHQELSEMRKANSQSQSRLFRIEKKPSPPAQKLKEKLVRTPDQTAAPPAPSKKQEPVQDYHMSPKHKQLKVMQ